MKELSRVLDELLEEVDKGSYPEDPREIEQALQTMEKSFRAHVEAMGLRHDASDDDFLDYWKKTLGIVPAR